MYHRDEAFDFIEQRVRYALLRDEGVDSIEATVRALAEADPGFASWKLKTPFYRLYIVFLRDLWEMDYARRHKEIKK